jgi:hypothetical protein
MLLVAGVSVVACVAAVAYIQTVAGIHDLIVIFSPIELSEYRITYWQIQETVGLSDIRTNPQSIGLSDIGHRKNYRLPTSGY